MEQTKIITQEDYDKLPGNGAAAILNGVGSDGQPVLKYAKCTLRDGSIGIVRYWIDENSQNWQKVSKFVAGESY